MNPLLINVIKAIAALAETPWKNRKSQALRRVIDQFVEISDCLAPLPHAPEDLEDFQQNLQALASTVEELDNTFDELQTADSPQETTSAVEMLDEASPPAAEPSTTYGRHQPGSLNSTDHTFANAALIAQFARRAGAGTFSRTRGLTTCACVSTCRRIACSWAALKSGNRAHRS